MCEGALASIMTVPNSQARSKQTFYKKLETRDKKQEDEAPAAPILWPTCRWSSVSWFVVGLKPMCVYMKELDKLLSSFNLCCGPKPDRFGVIEPWQLKSGAADSLTVAGHVSDLHANQNHLRHNTFVIERCFKIGLGDR